MAPLRLEDIEPGVRVVRGPTNLGIITRSDRSAVLIDSGNDDDAGRRLLQLARAEELRVDLVISTHGNADHIGGNAFLQSRTGCRIAATREEAPFIENPLMESSLLWGGRPHAGLRGKFLMARPSKVTDIIDSGGAIPGTDLTAVPLPGHYVGMIGVRTPGGTLFCADALASEEILRKYPVYFLYDVAGHLKTLDYLESCDASLFVPSHAEPVREIRPLAEANRRAVNRVNEILLELAAASPSWEECLAVLMDRLGIVPDHAQYVLVHSTIRSHISYLADAGAVALSYENGRMRVGRV